MNSMPMLDDFNFNEISLDFLEETTVKKTNAIIDIKQEKTVCPSSAGEKTLEKEFKLGNLSENNQTVSRNEVNDFDFDFLDASERETFKINLLPQYFANSSLDSNIGYIKTEKNSSSSIKYSSPRLSKRIAKVDELVRKLQRSEEEKKHLQQQLEDFSHNAKEIQLFYNKEKRERIEADSKNNALTSRCDELETELTSKSLELDQVKAQMDECNGPITYPKLALRYLTLAQKLEEERLLHWHDQTYVKELTKFCKDKGFKIPAISPRSPPKRKNIVARKIDAEIQCDILTANATNVEKPQVIQRNQAIQCENVKTRNQECQHIGTTTTRGTTTACFFKYHDVGTDCMPNETDTVFNRVLEEMKLYGVDCKPLSPIPDIPEPKQPATEANVILKTVSDSSQRKPTVFSVGTNTTPELISQNSIERKNIGTCTYICNVQRKIDFSAQPTISIKRSDSRPPSTNLLYETVKDELTSRSRTSSPVNMNLPSLNNQTSIILPNAFDELWKIFGHMLYGLLNRRVNSTDTFIAPNNITNQQEFFNWLHAVYNDLHTERINSQQTGNFDVSAASGSGIRLFSENNVQINPANESSNSQISNNIPLNFSNAVPSQTPSNIFKPTAQFGVLNASNLNEGTNLRKHKELRNVGTSPICVFNTTSTGFGDTNASGSSGDQRPTKSNESNAVFPEAKRLPSAFKAPKKIKKLLVNNKYKKVLNLKSKNIKKQTREKTKLETAVDFIAKLPDFKDNLTKNRPAGEIEQNVFEKVSLEMNQLNKTKTQKLIKKQKNENSLKTFNRTFSGSLADNETETKALFGLNENINESCSSEYSICSSISLAEFSEQETCASVSVSELDKEHKNEDLFKSLFGYYTATENESEASLSSNGYVSESCSTSPTKFADQETYLSKDEPEISSIQKVEGNLKKNQLSKIKRRRLVKQQKNETSLKSRKFFDSRTESESETTFDSSSSSESRSTCSPTNLTEFLDHNRCSDNIKNNSEIPKNQLSKIKRRKLVKQQKIENLFESLFGTFSDTESESEAKFISNDNASECMEQEICASQSSLDKSLSRDVELAGLQKVKVSVEINQLKNENSQQKRNEESFKSRTLFVDSNDASKSHPACSSTNSSYEFIDQAACSSSINRNNSAFHEKYFSSCDEEFKRLQIDEAEFQELEELDESPTARVNKEMLVENEVEQQNIVLRKKEPIDLEEETKEISSNNVGNKTTVQQLVPKSTEKCGRKRKKETLDSDAAIGNESPLKRSARLIARRIRQKETQTPKRKELSLLTLDSIINTNNNNSRNKPNSTYSSSTQEMNSKSATNVLNPSYLQASSNSLYTTSYAHVSTSSSSFLASKAIFPNSSNTSNVESCDSVSSLVSKTILPSSSNTSSVDCSNSVSSLAFKALFTNSSNTSSVNCSNSVSSLASKAIFPNSSNTSSVDSSNLVSSLASKALLPNSTNTSSVDSSNSVSSLAAKALFLNSTNTSSVDCSNSVSSLASKAIFPNSSNTSSVDCSNSVSSLASKALFLNSTNTSVIDSSNSVSSLTSKALFPNSSNTSSVDCSNSVSSLAAKALFLNSTNTSSIDSSNSVSSLTSKALFPNSSNTSSVDCSNSPSNLPLNISSSSSVALKSTSETNTQISNFSFYTKTTEPVTIMQTENVKSNLYISDSSSNAKIESPTTYFSFYCARETTNSLEIEKNTNELQSLAVSSTLSSMPSTTSVRNASTVSNSNSLLTVSIPTMNSVSNKQTNIVLVNFDEPPASPVENQCSTAQLPIEIPLEPSKAYLTNLNKSFLQNLLNNYDQKQFNNLQSSKRTINDHNKLVVVMKKLINTFLSESKNIITKTKFDFVALSLVQNLLDITNEAKFIAQAIILSVQKAIRPPLPNNTTTAASITTTTPIHDSLINQNFSTHTHRSISYIFQHFDAFHLATLIKSIELKMFNMKSCDKFSLNDLLNLTDLYLIVIRHQMCSTQEFQIQIQHNPARLFLAKCLYFYNVRSMPMIYAVLCAFPTVLPHREERSYDRSDPLITVIQHHLMCTKYDMNNNELRHRELLSKLRFEYHFDCFKPDYHEVLKNLMEKICAGKFYNLKLAFAIFCKRLKFERVLNDVLQQHLIPLTNEYYRLVEQSPDYEERLCFLIECFSIVLKPFPRETSKIFDLDIYSFLKSFFNLTERRHVQEAALHAILRLQRFDEIKCYQALAHLRFDFELKPHTRAALKTFIYRRPKNFWKSTILKKEFKN